MDRTENLSQRWEKYRPSKTLWFWSLAGVVAATIILGFTVGGWVTGGSAEEMATKSSRDSLAQLAASICVEKFVSADDAAAQLAALKETSSWERDTFVDKGGWNTLVGIDKPVAGSADLCAKELVAMEALPVRTVGPTAVDG